MDQKTMREEYLERAKEARKTAERVAHPETKDDMLKIASLWERLARRHEHDEDPKGLN